MDNVKTDQYYVGRICRDLDFMIRKMEQVERPSFAENELLQDSIL